MKAKRIMIKHIFMIESSVTVADAVKKMGDDRVSSLIVNRAHVDDAYGILTRRDVVNKVIATGKDPYKIKVSEIMSKPLVMTTPNLDIRYVAGLMQETGVRRVPVFDGHKMIGIISNGDVFRAFYRKLTEEKTERGH